MTFGWANSSTLWVDKTYLTAGETNGDNAQIVGVGEEAAFNETGIHCNGV
jgi:hypothetical protein